MRASSCFMEDQVCHTQQRQWAPAMPPVHLRGRRGAYRRRAQTKSVGVGFKFIFSSCFWPCSLSSPFISTHLPIIWFKCGASGAAVTHYFKSIMNKKAKETSRSDHFMHAGNTTTTSSSSDADVVCVWGTYSSSADDNIVVLYLSMQASGPWGLDEFLIFCGLTGSFHQVETVLTIPKWCQALRPKN